MMMKTKVVSPSLHRELTAYMDREGLTVRQMSALLGLSYNYLRRVINGELFPRRQTVLVICRKTGIDFQRVWRAVLEEMIAERRLFESLVTPAAGMENERRNYTAPKQKDIHVAAIEEMFSEGTFTDKEKEAIVEFVVGLFRLYRKAREGNSSPTEVPTSSSDPENE